MRILEGDELTTVYPELFKKVFGFESAGQIPRTVIVTDDLEGFVSGYLQDFENFYLSWGGHTKGFTSARRCFLEGEKALKDLGVKWFLTRVENTNTVWQRVLMKMDWVPYGMRVAGGKIYIEYCKEL